MRLDALSKLAAAGGAACASITKKWEQLKGRQREQQEEEEEEIDERKAQQIRERNEFLQLIQTKITGESVSEMAPLQYDENTTHRAVFLITIPISFGKFELSDRSYNLLAKHVGMSLDSVSHWAVCVIDRGLQPNFCYDLMSDRMEFAALGKNYFRVAEVTSEFVQTWSSCYYVGETTKTHEEIQLIGLSHTDTHPRYNLLSNNCQHLVDTLVKELCNGKVISQAKLDEELSLASPKIARDLIVARFRSKLEGKEHKHKRSFEKSREEKEKEDAEENETIREYLDAIKRLWEDKKRKDAI